MASYTGSISKGDAAPAHNMRGCYERGTTRPGNIDPERTAGNVVLVDRDLADVYHELFDDAVDSFNARQREQHHPERQVTDYLAKVEADKQLKPVYEFVVQVGNRDEHPPADVAETIYRDWLDDFSQAYAGKMEVAQAVVHNDEQVSHMHVEVVPVAESARGLPRQNSLTKAVEQCGYPRGKDGYLQMLDDWDSRLTKAMERQGLERVEGRKELQAGGIGIDAYRRTMRACRELERSSLAVRLDDAQRALGSLETAQRACRDCLRTCQALDRERAVLEASQRQAEGLRRQAEEIARDVRRVPEQARLRELLREVGRRVSDKVREVLHLPPKERENNIPGGYIKNAGAEEPVRVIVSEQTKQANRELERVSDEVRQQQEVVRGLRRELEEFDRQPAPREQQLEQAVQMVSVEPAHDLLDDVLNMRW